MIPLIYSWIIRLFCICLCLNSLEYLYSRRQYSDAGIFSWRMMKLSVPSRILQWKPDFLFKQTGVFVLQVIRLLSGLYLLIVPLSPVTVYLVAATAVISLVLNVRNSIGNDGSDQMNCIINITLLVSFVCNDPSISAMGLYFLAAQSVLAYVIAGSAKLLSGKWRSGTAVLQIMNTETFGYEPIARYLQGASPLVSRILAWNIMVFEGFFWVTVILPYPYFVFWLVWGLLFHLFNAFVMGLNRFFWAFLATYPAIVYVNMALHHSFHL